MRKEKRALSVLFLLILIFFLRLPSVFEPYWYGDEGITLTIGQQVKRGLVLYKDVVDNKTPLLYFLASKMVTLFNFKLLTLFWVLISLLYFLKLARVFTPKREVLVALIFIFLTSTPLFEGNIVNGEIYAILPMIISVYLIWQKYYFFSGIFASLAFLFKHPFLFDFLSLLIFLIFFNRVSLKNLLLKVFQLTTGFLLPLTLTIIYFYKERALIDFLHQSIFNNLRYISWETDVLIPQGLTLIKVMVLLLLVSLIYKSREKISKKEIFIFLWLIFSLFGATISTRPYPHYLLQIAPSFSLMIGIPFGLIKILVIILLLVINTIQFNLNFNSFNYLLAYYRNFLKGNSYEFYSKRVKTTYEIADFLKKNAGSNEPIFVWSDNTLIYALAQRPPVGKYIAAYHIKSWPGRKEETIQTLSFEKPRLIILTLPIKHPFPALATLLKKEYNLVKDEASYQIYERKSL